MCCAFTCASSAFFCPSFYFLVFPNSFFYLCGKKNPCLEICYNFTCESERPVEVGNPNTCAEVKLCLFLFMPALKIIKNSETELFETFTSVVPAKYKWIR